MKESGQYFYDFNYPVMRADIPSMVERLGNLVYQRIHMGKKTVTIGGKQFIESTYEIKVLTKP